jgi:hypothetical protein
MPREQNVPAWGNWSGWRRTSIRDLQINWRVRSYGRRGAGRAQYQGRIVDRIPLGVAPHFVAKAVIRDNGYDPNETPPEMVDLKRDCQDMEWEQRL